MIPPAAEDDGRREFLRKAITLSAGAALLGAASVIPGDECPFDDPGFTRPVIPNACASASTDLEKTLAAVVDTVIPGPGTDPAGDPGGLESCALNMLFDDFYPFRANAEALASIIDLEAKTRFGKAFVDCTYNQRVQALVKAQDGMPILRLVYRAVRSAFYGGAYNGVGLDYLAYPGPNLGYRHIAAASFRKPMSKELTETGWMP
jgi:hypothetical protein